MRERPYPFPTDAGLGFKITGIAVTDVREYQLRSGRNIVVAYRLNQKQGPQIREAVVQGYLEPRNFMSQLLFGSKVVDIPRGERESVKSELRNILEKQGVKFDKL